MTKKDLGSYVKKNKILVWEWNLSKELKWLNKYKTAIKNNCKGSHYSKVGGVFIHLIFKVDNWGLFKLSDFTTQALKPILLL